MTAATGTALPQSYTVAVVGLGLMGGSLAASLRRDQPQVRVLGVARREETLEAALRGGLVDDGGLSLAEVVPQADLTVLAAPVRTIVAQVAEAGALLREGGVLTDIGSTKQAVTSAMDRTAVAGQCLGGHPMCGRERHGLEAADPDLFRGASWVLCPGRETLPDTVKAVSRLARGVGARTLILDASWHDTVVARTSHLPYVVSAAVSRAVAKAVRPDDIEALSAGGYRDTTRLVAGDVAMMVDIIMTNRDSIRGAVREMRDELGRLESGLERGDEAWLASYLESARRERRAR